MLFHTKETHRSDDVTIVVVTAVPLGLIVTPEEEEENV